MAIRLQTVLTTLMLLAGAMLGGCLGDGGDGGGDGGDGGEGGDGGVPADAYTLTATGVPLQAAAGEAFEFTLEIEGDETRSSDHVGAHYGTTSTNEPSTSVYDQTCAHTAGEVPGTFTVTCSIPSAGTYYLRGHLRITEDGQQTNFWTDTEHRVLVAGANATLGTVAVGTDATFPPFEEVDPETGEFTGFDIDLMDEVGRRAGFTPEYQNLGFDVLIESLKQGEIDAIVSAMSITDARSQEVDFSIPYYEANQSVMFRSGEEQDYDSLEDLEGQDLRFGAQSGTVGADIVVEEFGEDALTQYDTYPLAVAALKRGDVDAVVMDAPAQEEAAEDDPEVVVAFDFSVDDVYGIAVQKGDNALLTAINTALTSMYADGTIDELRDKWGI